MIRKGYVDTPDGQIHYRYTEGGRGAPLVLFHMTADTSESYEHLMAAFDGEIPTIAFDTPNYGESFRTGRTATIGYISDTFVAALDALGLSRFHSFGHHTGASIALDLAVRYPERAVSATLNGMCAVTKEEGAFWLEALAFPNPATRYGSQIIAAWTRINKLEKADVGFPAAIKARATTAMLRAGEDWSWGYRAVFTDDGNAKLAAVKVPVFFVVGRQDLICDMHLKAASLVPHASSYVAEDHGVFYCENGVGDLKPRLLDFMRAAETAPAAASYKQGRYT